MKLLLCLMAVSLNGVAKSHPKPHNEPRSCHLKNVQAADGSYMWVAKGSQGSAKGKYLKIDDSHSLNSAFEACEKYLDTLEVPLPSQRKGKP